MKNLNKYIPWAITVVFALLLLAKSCGAKTSPQNSRVQVIKTTDTVVVTKTIKIPQIKQVFVKSKPKPITITISGKDTLKTYLNTYTDSTGVAQVTVQDSLKGTLLNQVVSIKVKEREIQYKEKTITNTTIIKQKPKLVLSLGANTAIGPSTNIGVEATIKNGNGWNIDLGYNTRNQILIGIKKDIITIYDKHGPDKK